MKVLSGLRYLLCYSIGREWLAESGWQVGFSMREELAFEETFTQWLIILSQPSSSPKTLEGGTYPHTVPLPYFRGLVFPEKPVHASGTLSGVMIFMAATQGLPLSTWLWWPAGLVFISSLG